MTVKGDDSKKDAVTRESNKVQEEQEQVPTYQEAVEGGSSSSSQPPVAISSTGKQAPATAPPPTAQSSVYPFPSRGTTQPGYGQSPYQSNGTLPIVVVQGNNILPLHATAPRRGPRAGRRFLFAFLWALLLYMAIAAMTGALVQMQERAHQPKTPPGWHHHH